MISLERLHHLTSILVDVTILISALVAIVKLRIYNLFSRRWRSELTCAHCDLPDGRVLFTADYTLHNTGQRPLTLSAVDLRLVTARTDGPLVIPDETNVLAERHLRPSDPGLRGLFQIEAGERTIFPIRCLLDRLDDIVFVLCSFDTTCGRASTAYRGVYCRYSTPTPGARDGDRSTPPPSPPPHAPADFLS